MGGLGLEIVENCPMSSLRGTFSSGKEVVEGGGRAWFVVVVNFCGDGTLYLVRSCCA